MKSFHCRLSTPPLCMHHTQLLCANHIISCSPLQGTRRGEAGPRPPLEAGTPAAHPAPAVHGKTPSCCVQMTSYRDHLCKELVEGGQVHVLHWGKELLQRRQAQRRRRRRVGFGRPKRPRRRGAWCVRVCEGCRFACEGRKLAMAAAAAAVAARQRKVYVPRSRGRRLHAAPGLHGMCEGGKAAAAAWRLVSAEHALRARACMPDDYAGWQGTGGPIRADSCCCAMQAGAADRWRAPRCANTPASTASTATSTAARLIVPVKPVYLAPAG